MDGVPYEAALSIWRGIEDNWIGLVTSWNRGGVRWRDFSGAELIWLVHTSTIDQMKEDAPRSVRRYLTDTKDFAALREWDKAQMKESSD